MERKASETFYPTYLDCPNEPERVDIPLLFFPFYPTVPQQEAGGRNSALESAVASVEVDNWLKTSTTLSHHDRRHLLFARKLTPHSP